MRPNWITAPLFATLASFAVDAQESQIAARGAGVIVRVDAVERLLLERHGMSTHGRELLDLLLKSRLLDRLAQDAELEVSQADITKRWSELDRLSLAHGDAGGLRAQIERQGLEAAEFSDFLRLAIIHEELTRRALGLSESAKVDAAQQEVWLANEIQTRILERPVAPWSDGFAARCGDLTISTDEFATFLRARLPREDVQKSCWHLLLLAGIEKRMPDLSDAAAARGIESEIQRRRAESIVQHPALTFEQRLGALGRTVELLRLDPSVRIAALSRIWVDRTFGPKGLRESFEAERAFYEGRFGRAARANMLFLVAGRFVNELNPRSFTEAERQLTEFKTRIGDVADFEALASEFSEEPTTRQNRGRLGWVTRAEPSIPVPVREALFEFLDSGGSVPSSGRSVGPVRLDSGSALLWIAEVRESPSWESMSEHVHEELRRRFIVDVMPTGAMEVLLFEASAPRATEKPQ